MGGGGCSHQGADKAEASRTPLWTHTGLASSGSLLLRMVTVVLFQPCCGSAMSTES